MNRILNGDVTVTYDRLTRIATALHTRLSTIIQRAEALASKEGESRRTMNRILNGDVTVTYDRLTRIATALHTRLSTIIQRAEALASKEGEEQ